MAEFTTTSTTLQNWRRSLAGNLAFLFEGDSSSLILSQIPEFIRGAESSTTDGAFIILNQVFQLLTQKMGPLNPTTRLFELLKIPEIGSKRFLVAIDFKTLGRFISLKSGGNHWYWIIRISPEQKEYCGALIVGFLEHPGWQALVPISALKWDGPFSPEKDTYWVAGWRVSAKRKLLNTIPPKLWPYVVPNACLKQALLAWKSYAASTQQTW